MHDFYICPNMHAPDLADNNLLFQALPILIKSTFTQHVSDVHWHDYLQIWYTASGTYRHTINGVTYPQGPGSVMLVFPYMPHSIDTSQSDLSELSLFRISVKNDAFQTYCVPFLSHSYLSASFDSFYLHPDLSFSGKEKNHLDQICADLTAEYSKKADMQTNKLLSLIAAFLELCIQKADRTLSARERSLIYTRNECIEEAMAFLKKNSAQNITLDDVSRAAMMSRRAYTATFNSAIGRTSHAYLNSLRMKNAVEMLRKTPNSISQIAEEAGFYDSSHFRQKCIEMYGVPPNVLRRNLSQWSREHNEAFMNTVQEMRWTQVFDEACLQRNECSMSFY